MFNIKMIAAGHGDCLWLEYGDEQQPFRILIDGGTAGTFKRVKKRIKVLPEDQRHFELLVITHIDADHIAGVLKLLDDEELGVTFGDIWFNGYRHLPTSPLESLGVIQGERLTDVLARDETPWNEAFDGGALIVEEGQPLPVSKLRGGLQLTLLSPTPATLRDLKGQWEEEARKAGLDPNDPRADTDQPARRRSGLEALGGDLPDVDALAETEFSEDGSEANGSSIAFLVEYDGIRVLLSGDAYALVLENSIKQLTNDCKKLRLDAFKTPHHGSKSNISATLLKTIDCDRYLISTNGAYFKHPDEIAVARIIKYGGKNVELYFNYLSKYTEIWTNARLLSKYGYVAKYPVDEQDGLTLRL